MKRKVGCSKSDRVANRFREGCRRLNIEGKQNFRRNKREFINGLTREAEETTYTKGRARDGIQNHQEDQCKIKFKNSSVINQR
jgi:hypothetical protein